MDALCCYSPYYPGNVFHWFNLTTLTFWTHPWDGARMIIMKKKRLMNLPLGHGSKTTRLKRCVAEKARCLFVCCLVVLPPVLVRLVLLASVGVSSGLLRESGGSDSMCGCWLWWCGLEKMPFCCTAPPAIIFSRTPILRRASPSHEACRNRSCPPKSQTGMK